ncbi:MAG: hypothetical protein ACTSPY_12535 [Candidatus Helarchaeota archaeon]
MKFMFILLKKDQLYRNRLIRFIPEFFSYFAANGIRPVIYTLDELKKIINRIDHNYISLSNESPAFLIRPCPCRDAQRKYSKKLPNITDILFTSNKKNFSETKNNRFITKSDLFKKLDYFDKKGLVHIVLGCMGVNGGGINICNCHKSVCFVLQAVLGRDMKRGLEKGPSVAVVDQNKCKGIEECGICLERCVFHARTVENGLGKVVLENCYGCGLCANSCPEHATIMVLRNNYTPTYFPLNWIK